MDATENSVLKVVSSKWFRGIFLVAFGLVVSIPGMALAVDLQSRSPEVRLGSEGLSAKFHWRDRERPSPGAYRSQNERAEIAAAELKQKAVDGDAFAAFQLSVLLLMCSRAYVEEQDLQEAIDLLLSSHLFKGPNSQEILQLAAPEQAQELATLFIEQFEACEGISAEK
jgi:hypothetical protein